MAAGYYFSRVKDGRKQGKTRERTADTHRERQGGHGRHHRPAGHEPAAAPSGLWPHLRLEHMLVGYSPYGEWVARRFAREERLGAFGDVDPHHLPCHRPRRTYPHVFRVSWPENSGAWAVHARHRRSHRKRVRRKGRKLRPCLDCRHRNRLRASPADIGMDGPCRRAGHRARRDDRPRIVCRYAALRLDYSFSSCSLGARNPDSSPFGIGSALCPLAVRF